MPDRRGFLAGLAAMALARPLRAETDFGMAIARAAEAQVGVVRIYDPAYVGLDFPGGDVAPDRGVCTDVLIRALRVSADLDLQSLVNRDMKAAFSAYPALWGLTRPDRNIDHRRVPNLRAFLKRKGAELSLSPDPTAFLPGDVVTSTLPGGLAHLVLVASGQSRDGTRPLIVHNIGRGTQIEDRLFDFDLTGHYRLSDTVLRRLRG